MNQPATPAAALPVAQSTHAFAPDMLLNATICPRCGGSGHLSHYRHVERGRCFRCKGSGQVPVLRAA